MFVRPTIDLAVGDMQFSAGTVYDVTEALGIYLRVRAKAEPVPDASEQFITALMSRLDEGANRTCVFLPFVGEFGHLILSHTRLVHFHRARRKIVCCRPGQEVLFPSADQFVTDWQDPFPDTSRAGTMRAHLVKWPDLVARFPWAVPIAAGGLTPTQELHYIRPGHRIPFSPRRRNLRPDVVIGVRHRQLSPERNWSHWEKLARALTAHGLTFAVTGALETSYDLPGQLYHTGDLDTAAAVESLQNGRLYIGTDSGASHLAAAVGAPMLVFRESDTPSRDMLPLMEQRNPGKVTRLEDGIWTRPDDVIQAALNLLL